MMKNHEKSDLYFSSIIGFFYNYDLGIDDVNNNVNNNDMASYYYNIAIENGYKLTELDFDLNRNYENYYFQLENVIIGKYLLLFFYYKDHFIKLFNQNGNVPRILSRIRSSHNHLEYDEIIQNVENRIKLNMEYNLEEIHFLLLCIKFGLKDEKELNNLFNYYKYLEEKGNVLAQMNLAYCYLSGIETKIDIRMVFNLYFKSAMSGNSIAQNYLGYYYKNGIGINKDEKEAFKWYLKSAEGGNHNAQINLGICYRRGIGINEDKKKAFDWYLKSAGGGNRDAQNEIGNCYYFGKGVGKDYGKAFKWYLKSTNDHDQRNIRNDLESCQKNVISNNKNYQYRYEEKINCEEKSIFELHLKSAEEGDSNAQIELGKCYFFGKGVDKNHNKAFEWYLKSANKGNHIAENELGKLYYFIDKNFDKTFEWYMKSAEGGNSDGQYNLGFCYHCGIGCKKNIEKAGYWYKKASDNGSLNAKNVLDNSSLFLFMKKSSSSVI
ncbi:unnamed protein product [Rhizophagus irregularis]|nr:unnamed protein product [Rhizophagus irregularis]